MKTEDTNLVMQAHREQHLLPNGNLCHIPLKRPAPGLTILVHGVNDIGETYPFQEQGICDGLNKRLKRCTETLDGEVVNMDMIPNNYTLPPKKNGVKFTADEVHPDPDKVYFARSEESRTSPVIGFYWGFREETAASDRSTKGKNHGERLDQYGNRIDKRYAKNGGPFANATTNIPDMFGPGFDQDRLPADPHNPTHPLMSAPPRTYMVLAAQRLAALIRIIRNKSKNEPINIVAHSQGCFITTLAHAILAMDGQGTKADTIIYNNWPYSVDEPWAEKFQSRNEQQTTAAREATLEKIIAYITSNPATTPKFSELKTAGNGVVNAAKWAHNQNKERDNRGKCYLYFSPDDATVGLLNVQGIGYWGVYDGMLKRLGPRFYQRVFARRDGPTKKAPPIGSPTQDIWLGFKWTLETGVITLPRSRPINGEELPQTFDPGMGPAELEINPLDAAIAVTNTYNVKDKEGIRANETAKEAHARWMNKTDPNSYHSSIVSNPMHSQKATAYDLCVGVSGILKNEDMTWMQFLRAVADWRTNWFGVVDEEKKKNNPSYPPPSENLVSLLKSSEIDAADREVVEGNYYYYNKSDTKIAGELPAFTTSCTVASLAPYVVSETIGYLEQQRQKERMYQSASLNMPQGRPVLARISLTEGGDHA